MSISGLHPHLSPPHGPLRGGEIHESLRSDVKTVAGDEAVHINTPELVQVAHKLYDSGVTDGTRDKDQAVADAKKEGGSISNNPWKYSIAVTSALATGAVLAGYYETRKYGKIVSNLQQQVAASNS